MEKETYFTDDTSYAVYEELIRRRDSLRKHAAQYEMSYMAKFGKQIIAVFELKIECIRKKKLIGYCQARTNRGQSIDQKALQAYIEKEMQVYQHEMKRIVGQYQCAGRATKVTGEELREIKRLYRRIARRIHPDMTELTLWSEELAELWERTVQAYRYNDYEELQQIEVLVNETLKRLGYEDQMGITIKDMEGRMKKLKKEIRQITSTNPYLYGEILEDEEKISRKQKELEEEQESYKQYSKELEEILTNLMKSGVTLVWQMNS